jgi:hypothetical protein
MDEYRHLLTNRNKQAKSKQNQAARLGDVVKKIMTDQIAPKQARSELITQQWEDLLPIELQNHCRLEGLSAGQLKVTVDSPCYMHELRLCSPQLLQELQQRCPQARIDKIKLAIG